MILRRYLFIMTMYMTFYAPVQAKTTLVPTSYAYYGAGVAGALGAMLGAYIAQKQIKKADNKQITVINNRKSVIDRIIAAVAGCCIAGGVVFWWIYTHTPAYLFGKLITQQQKLKDDLADAVSEKEKRDILHCWFNMHGITHINYYDDLHRKSNESCLDQQDEGKKEKLRSNWKVVYNQVKDLYKDGYKSRCNDGLYLSKYPLSAEINVIVDYKQMINLMHHLPDVQMLSDVDKKHAREAEKRLVEIIGSLEYKVEQDQKLAELKREFKEREARYQRQLKKEKLRAKWEKNSLKREELWLKQEKPRVTVYVSSQR